MKTIFLLYCSETYFLNLLQLGLFVKCFFPSGDGPNTFILQFGSISPGLMDGMQVSILALCIKLNFLLFILAVIDFILFYFIFCNVPSDLAN